MLNENEFSDECAFCMLHNIFMEAKLQSLSSQKHQPSDIIIDLINLMRKNLHNPELDFESLASQNGIMPESLNKRFKKETGMPLHQYFLQLKINAAKSILANLNYRISDLADFLGFEDQYYFSRLFKKKTGLSPINYRKQMILKQQPEFVKKEKKSRKP
jgi:two-component system response regulator YesN